MIVHTEGIALLHLYQTVDRDLELLCTCHINLRCFLRPFEDLDSLAEECATLGFLDK
jgi:hypothetical protein